MADRQKFVDLIGLTLQPNKDEYAASLNLDGEFIRTEDDRLRLLAGLRDGAGVNVVTGPLGAPFWSLASIEVRVRVEPDGTDYDFRTQSHEAWSLMALGMTETEAVSLVRAYGQGRQPPTPRHGQYDRWVRADALRQRLSALTASAVPIVVQAFAVNIIRDPAEQLRLVEQLDEFCALDWEWEISSSHSPIGLSVSTGDRNYYLPLWASDFRLGEDHGERLRGLLGHRLGSDLRTVFHNARADLGTQHPGDPLSLSGRELDDTLVLAYLAGEPELGLKPLTRKYFPDRDPMDYPRDDEDHGLEVLPVELGARYAAAGDTRNTYDLFFKLKQRVEERGQWDVYTRFERPLVPIIASMERYGSPVDMTEVQRLREEHWQAEEEIRQRVQRESGFDLSDDGQTRQYIRSKTGYDPGTLDKRALAKYRDAWMDEIIHPESGYRPLRTRRRNFLDKLIERWNAAGRPSDFRAYPSFNQAGTSVDGDPRSFRAAPRSGRLSSSRPNFQNQPRSIRSAFVAPPGDSVFWSLDYSGLELHIAAAVSRDPAMLAVLAGGGDLHSDFLGEIIQRTGRDPGRPAAKQGNFEQLYGGGIDKLVQILAVQRIHIAYDMAKIIVETHRERHSVYHAYGAGVIEQARRNGGYAQTLFGRRRYEQDLFSNDPETRSWAERALVNTTIQGTAADIVKQAMVWAVPVLLHFNAHLSIQVHDELCGWLPRDSTEPFLNAMKAVMAAVPLPGLTLKVEGGAGQNWGAVHG